jgi:hypothetical protein
VDSEVYPYSDLTTVEHSFTAQLKGTGQEEPIGYDQGRECHCARGQQLQQH